MKSIANYISISRIILSFSLVFTKPLGTVFIVIYLICGISDMIDGFIARKTNTTSKLGEKLDSVADFIMVVILIILLYPIINLPVQIIIWVIIITVIRIVSIIIVYIKYKKLAILHTNGNKMTGLLLFILPLSLAFFQSDLFFYIICLVASFSSLEELTIHLISKELNVNKKGMFLKS